MLASPLRLPGVVSVRRPNRTLIRVVVIAVSLATVGLIGLAGLDYWRVGRISHSCQTHAKWQRDAALVLSGAPALRRTRVAVRAWRGGHLPRIFISGAGSGGDNAEGLARQASAELGVPARVFTTERRATSTADNLAFSCPLLRKAGATHVALVTDRWHMARAMASANALCPPVKFCALPADSALTPHHHRQETLALLVYQLTGNAAWFF
tara:strand:+ start:764 stop:1393 length:630 start_codon:yes stop_codon:yes gene_type:complete